MKTRRVAGPGILGWMFLVLFTLKLLGKIALSWWIVTLPLWGPLLIAMIFVFGAFVWAFTTDSKGF